MNWTSFLALVLAFVPAALFAASRETETVRLVRQIEPSVVAIFAQGEGAGSTGSGCVIHEDGFIVTCDHVVRSRPGHVLFSDGTVLPYRTVGRLPEKDLAIILVPAKQKLPAVPLGRSHDLMPGESLICAGNPGGRGTVFSSGIVSSRAMLIDAPNALVMTRFNTDARDHFIQFDATSNRGNSGGPLVNSEGKLIGIVAVKFFQEENINFAIPVDRLREKYAEIMAPEAVGGFWLGVQVDLLAERAVIAGVEKGSPAATAGLQLGDVLTSANAHPLRHGADWMMAISGGRPGRKLAVEFERLGKKQTATLTAAEYPAVPGVKAEGKKAGLIYRLYHTDRLKQLPDFSKLNPAETGVANTLAIDTLARGRTEDYALEFEGFLRVPTNGLYRVILRSDDGSRVLIDGKLVVDNDRNHPPMDASHRTRLTAGLHAVRIEYFQGTGGAELKLLLQTDDEKIIEPGLDSFFHE